MSKTKEIQIGNKRIGGNNPILIQSMTNTKTVDIDKTVQQILELEKEGCDIIRVATPDILSAKKIKFIKDKIHIPIVADIHFDYKIALTAIENGADKIRINPGNIGNEEQVKEIINTANNYKIPIRVGVNSGSIPKDLLEKYNGPTAQALSQAAIRLVKKLEDLNFNNIVVSLKSSSPIITIEANELLSKELSYPLHLGVTEAGIEQKAIIKSSFALGNLLYQGIGDTIRISITGDPKKEIQAAKDLLSALELRENSVDVISCPTCARTKIDVINLAQQVTDLTRNIEKPLKIAVMGCEVNGPGEAKEADLGIAGAGNKSVLFKNGKVFKTVEKEKILDTLKKEIEKL